MVADAPPGPWRKGAAVACATRQATGQIVVVADADVTCPGVDAAVRAVCDGAPWAVPHRNVYRLTPAATREILAGGPLPQVATATRHRDVQLAHTGMVGGGMVVLPAATLDAVPMDPRFAGWGQEDMAWARALSVMVGAPWRGVAPLIHLWHPEAPRLGPARTVGSHASWELWLRYRRAVTRREMGELLGEQRQPIV